VELLIVEAALGNNAHSATSPTSPGGMADTAAPQQHDEVSRWTCDTFA
jgi:hypothetical protein